MKISHILDKHHLEGRKLMRNSKEAQSTKRDVSSSDQHQNVKDRREEEGIIITFWVRIQEDQTQANHMVSHKDWVRRGKNSGKENSK